MPFAVSRGGGGPGVDFVSVESIEEEEGKEANYLAAQSIFVRLRYRPKATQLHPCFWIDVGENTNKRIPKICWAEESLLQ